MEDTFHKRILNPNLPVILYELTPPVHTAELQSIYAYVSCAMDLFKSTSIRIDAINIPEIRDEAARNGGTKLAAYQPKTDACQFADLFQEASDKQVEVILNHCTVYETWDEQRKWLHNAVYEHGISNLILVGGERSGVAYPGPSVCEMSEHIKKEYKSSVLCGGITIQARRHEVFAQDEPHRMVTKINSGIDFFTSQIIYEAESVINLLRDYSNLCQRKSIVPKRVFLSFAPISTQSDLEFLRWLGVNVPNEIAQSLFITNIGTGWRSVKIVVNILQEILNAMRAENIDVPLGLNIEHINKHNFELTKELIEQLGSIYLNYVNVYRNMTLKI